MFRPRFADCANICEISLLAFAVGFELRYTEPTEILNGEWIFTRVRLSAKSWGKPQVRIQEEFS